MRKFLQVALEAEDPRLADPAYQTEISMEEEAMLMDEAHTAATSADQELDDMERISDISDAMEDLAEIAGGIEKLNPNESALIDTAANMAVAGSGQTGEEIIPCMEAFIGRRIATESIERIKESAKKIWESIKKFLTSVWEKITEFFYKTFSTIPNIRKNIESVKEKIKSIGGNKAGEASFQMKAYSQVMVGGKMPANEQDLQRDLGELAKECDHVFGKYMQNVVNIGKTVASEIGAFNPESPDEAMDSFVAKISPFISKPKQGLFDVALGKEMMGGFRLVESMYNAKGDTAASKMEAIRKARVEFKETEAKNKATGVKFTTMSPEGMLHVLEDALSLLDVLENYKRGSLAKSVDAVKKEIQVASEKAKTAIGGLNETGEKTARAMATYQAMLNFNAVYAVWVKTPAIPVCRSSLMSVKGVLEVVNKSLAQYKPVKDAKPEEVKLLK